MTYAKHLSETMSKRTKKEKAAGLEKHRQLEREKNMKRKQKKQIELPTKHRKDKK